MNNIILKFEDFENQKNVLIYTKLITGHAYSFAITSARMWGKSDVEHTNIAEEPFYQLMPHHLDDGFFDWYCYVREYYQFFKTKEMCIIHFVFYWDLWNKNGRQDWQAEIKK